MKPNVVKDAFASTLKSAGFSRRADSWFTETNDAVLVANLQKSNFGDQYYVNLGIWLKALGEARSPKEHKCHIRIRATALDPKRQKYWERQVFDLEHKGSEAQRFDLVRSFLETIALPFLLSAGSVSQLRSLWQEGRLNAAAVMSAAQRILQA